VIQRKTQALAYWRDQFDLTGEDIDNLYDLILDGGQPIATAELAEVLIGRHVRLEEEALRAELGNGRLYQPKEAYQVGERLVFPALGFAFGTVADSRSGSSPDYGDFTVIQVQMEEDGRIRDFASGLVGDHALNRDQGDKDLLAAEDLLPVSGLYAEYGSVVEEMLVAALNEREEFVPFQDKWFLRELLAEIQTGHLHIAEALIEIRGMPLPTTEFLSDFDLPAEIPREIQALSVSSALQADSRFDNVGDSGRDIWYLRRLAPEVVTDPPGRLVVVPTSYDRDDITQELLLIEREIDDEGSGEEVFGPSQQIYRTTLSLTYPHWRWGTLPLTVRNRGLFPQATTHHTPVVLVDGQTGDKMQGWIVHEAGFVYGLGGWYERHRLPAGAYIDLERTRDPRVINVNFRPLRLQHQWTRIAAVKGGRLVFQLRKVPIACEYDDLLAIGEEHRAALDEVVAQAAAAGEGLHELMLGIVPELAKLSPQGTVHAKTIYSAVNVLKRVAPGPVFGLLSKEPRFVPTGVGYWAVEGAITESGIHQN
jgi:hypothetical protein